MSTLREDVRAVRAWAENGPASTGEAFQRLLTHLDEAGKLLRATQPGLMNFREWSDAIDVWIAADEGRAP